MLVLSDFIFFSVIKFSSIQIENIRCQAKEKTNDCYKLLYGIKIAIDVKRISNLVFFNWLFSFLNFVLPYCQNNYENNRFNWHTSNISNKFSCWSSIFDSRVYVINICCSYKFSAKSKKKEKKKRKKKNTIEKAKKTIEKH